MCSLVWHDFVRCFQVSNLHGFQDNLIDASEATLARYLVRQAEAENPGATVTELQREPFKDVQGKVCSGALAALQPQPPCGMCARGLRSAARQTLRKPAVHADPVFFCQEPLKATAYTQSAPPCCLQDVVQVDAGVVVHGDHSNVFKLGECKLNLDTMHLFQLVAKSSRIRCGQADVRWGQGGAMRHCL